MPFNLSQIFGGWRKKEGRTQKPSDFRREKNKSTPSAPSFAKKTKETADFPATGQEKAPVSVKNRSELAWKSLISPHISEKASMFGEGAYVLKVKGSASKGDIKRAAEDRYDINVISVNTVNIPPKKRVRGRVSGYKPGYKKAVIKIESGQTIAEF